MRSILLPGPACWFSTIITSSIRLLCILRWPFSSIICRHRLHLVIAGRTDPPLSLARLRARDQLIELRAADLSFTPIESTAFLNEIMRLNLTQADIAALAERTEGWIAGLQMAALSLQGREDRSEFVRAFTGSHRFLLDYLIEEVLDRQTRRAQPPGSGESRAKWVCCSRFPCSSSSLGSNKYPRRIPLSGRELMRDVAHTVSVRSPLALRRDDVQAGCRLSSGLKERMP